MMDAESSVPITGVSSAGEAVGPKHVSLDMLRTNGFTGPIARKPKKELQMADQNQAGAHMSGAEKLKSVKAAWDKAPAGPKKDASLKHYQAAEKAMTAKDEKTCMTECKAAEAALA